MTKKDEYRIACYICGVADTLQMAAYRNDVGQMVGWIFVCSEHFDEEVSDRERFARAIYLTHANTDHVSEAVAQQIRRQSGRAMRQMRKLLTDEREG